MDKAMLGRLGEDAAAKYLRKKRYSILLRNEKIGHWEQDIVAENREFLVFCEVKSRTVNAQNEPSAYGRPASAVDAKKQQNLLSFARAYLRNHPTKKRIRFDVIEVLYSRDGEQAPLSVTHIEGAFSAR